MCRSLDFLGRVDFQIKLNGQRVEAGEIESVLRDVEGVDDAIVTLSKSSSGLSRLVGYVLPAAVNVDMASEICMLRLPAYMVPSALLALEEWPLGSAGKVDQKMLPCLVAESSTSKNVKASPKTAVHCCLWRAIRFDQN